MLYRLVRAQFVSACDALYPGEYSKEQLADIFAKNVNHIIESTGKSSAKYIDYCKTLVVNRDNNIDIATINSFNQILESNEECMLSEEDRRAIIDTFIKEFLDIFPDTFTYNELFNIIDINVKSIVIEPLGINRYLPDQKKIVLNHIVFDRVTFHEFIHAIRGDIPCHFIGIDEGMVDLCAFLYDQNTSLDKVDFSTSAYYDLVKHAYKFCLKYPQLLHDYLVRKNVLMKYLENDFDILHYMEEIYALYDSPCSYETKELLRDEYSMKIDELFKEKTR